jgi:hypothetical protein
MITNKGKNIIAKYLIGEAPAYASYLALGCGPRPRPNITEKTNVSMGTISGTILSTGNPTEVIGLSSTAGLVVGMTLVQTSGVGPGFGSFGGTTTITSIDTATRITVTSTSANVVGPVTFSTTGVASLLSVSSTDGLWIGAKVILTGGTGQLATQQETMVTAISSSTNFTITPAPTVNLSSATLSIEVDPKKDVMDFEMFRVPISSRGYVNDNGVNKVVLTAQLPTEERYQITEVGVYSAGSNALAGQYDSKTITALSGDENWQLSLGNSLVSPEPSNPSNEVLFPEFQLSLINSFNNITTEAVAIKTSTTNNIFLNSIRAERYESPRLLNNVFLLKSDSSQIFTTSLNENSELSVQSGANFLQLNGVSVDLSKNSVSDIMKVAFSIVSKTGNAPTDPDFVRVVVEFANSDNTKIARLQINANNSKLNFSENRYVVGQKRLDELFYNTDGQFSWRDVSVIRIYASAIDRISVTNKDPDGALFGGTPTSVKITAIDNATSISYRVTGGASPIAGTVLNLRRTSGSPLAIDTEAIVQNIVRVGETNVWNAKLTGLTSTSGLVVDDIITAEASTTAVITTASSHNLVEGDYFSMFDVDSDFDGISQVSDVVSATKFKLETTQSVLSETLTVDGTLDVASKEYYIALDALRIDNVSTENPLYGLVGYSIIQNADEEAIIKAPNTNNYIEYRFILDVT